MNKKQINYIFLSFFYILSLQFSLKQSLAQLMKMDTGYRYNREYILVQFSPEIRKLIEEQVKEGKIPTICGKKLYGKLKQCIPEGNIWCIEPDEGETVEELLEKYKSDDSLKIEYVQFDYEYDAQWSSVDQDRIKDRIFHGDLKIMRDYMWYLNTVNIDKAWSITRGSRSVIIAILDTGLAYQEGDVPLYEALNVQSKKYLTSPVLKKINLWKDPTMHQEDMTERNDHSGYDFVNGDRNPNDDNGHGTYIASIIASIIGQNENDANHYTKTFLTVIDGFIYDTTAQTLNEGNGHYKLQNLDGERYEVNKNGYWTSFRFSNPNIPPGAIPISVIFHCVHYEEAEFTHGNLIWEVGTGWPETPEIWGTTNAPVREGRLNETDDSWKVTDYITLSDIHKMEFRIKNLDINKKSKIDHIYAEVTWKLPNDGGIAPNCSIMNLKVLDYKGRGYSSRIAEGIYYAVDHGANIINLSLSWPPGLNPGPVMSDAIEYAVNKGVIVIAGAGNNGRNSICYPAAYKNVISVGAIQFNNILAYYSNYGCRQELVMPGGNIREDLNQDGYPDGILQQTLNPKYSSSVNGDTLANTSSFAFEFIQGTSIATAQVTGIVALMLSLDPTLSLTDIRSILYDTAGDLGPAGWDIYYGYGVVDAGTAIARVASANRHNKNYLYVMNGYYSKERSSTKKLKNTDIVKYCDSDWLDIKGGGDLVSFKFSDANIPEDARVTSMVIYCGHNEEEGFTPGNLIWEIVSGQTDPLQAWATISAPVHQGKASENTDSWDVTSSLIPLTSKNINKMQFVVRNIDRKKKTQINNICVKVTWKTEMNNIAYNYDKEIKADCEEHLNDNAIDEEFVDSDQNTECEDCPDNDEIEEEQ